MLKGCRRCASPSSTPDCDKALGEGLGEDDGRAADPAHWTVEPWADPVDGAALADELVDVFTRHIVLPP